MCTFCLVGVTYTPKTKQNVHGGGGGVSVQRPPQGPSKTSVFYHKFNKNHKIFSNLLLVADILQTTVQPSHKPLYYVVRPVCVFVWGTQKGKREARV